MSSKVKILLLTIVMVVTFASIALAESVRYINIDHISIKLNIEFDLDDIETESIPDVSYGEDASASVWTNNTKYEIESAEWERTDPDYFKIGAEPRIVIYLTTKEYEYESSEYYERVYRFNSSYSSSTVSVSNGSFVSAHKESNSSLRLIVASKPIKGTYNTPMDAYWDGDTGVARWVGAETRDSGYYTLALKRGNSSIANVALCQGYFYNFAPYINKAGNYSFTIRTVGKDGTDKYGKKSELSNSGEWVVTDEMLARGISGGGAAGGGTGGTGGGATGYGIGWELAGNYWYYKNQDGSYVKDAWKYVGNRWYNFDDLGRMRTGWWTSNKGLTYYFKPSGSMAVGWLNYEGFWYFFNNTNDTYIGSMLSNIWWNDKGKLYYFDAGGRMVTGWHTIKDEHGIEHQYYFYPQTAGSSQYGFLATSTNINGIAVDASGKRLY